MDIQQRFVEAYNTYMQTLQSAWMPADVQARGTAAYNKYLQVMQEIWQPESQKRAAEAWGTYEQVLQDGLKREGMQQLTKEAYREYVRTVRDAWTQLDANSVDISTMAVICQSMMAVASMAAAGTDGIESAFGNVPNLPPELR